MSQYPRRVLTATNVTWGNEAFFVRAGTVVDIKPGSLLETAYGGSSNLSGVITQAQIGGDGAGMDHAAVSN